MNGIHPPACGSARAAALLLLFFLTATLRLSAQSPTLNPEGLAYDPGAAALRSLVGNTPKDQVAKVVNHMLEQSFDIVLVRIRTDINEVPGHDLDLLRNLQVSRVNLLKDLFRQTGKIERDQLQIHSSISYDGKGTTITFEYLRHAYTLDSLTVAKAVAAMRSR